MLCELALALAKLAELGVLILLFLEDALRENRQKVMPYGERNVLILLFLEDALREYELASTEQIVLQSLNPSFFGRCSARV